MLQFREKGWNLTQEGFNRLSNNGVITNFSTLLQSALNTDLRDIGAASFPTDAKSKLEAPKQGLVIQIVKVTRNVAAPKANQESKFAPRLLKIQFTDGQSQFSGIEMEHISQLSLSETKPGTKLYLRPGKVVPINQDLLLLRPNQFDFLGGHVKDLVEKWEVAQRYSKYANVRAASQAPPWIAFGQKIDRKAVDLSKKSLAAAAADKPNDEDRGDDPFDSQRKEAIAEAQKMDSRRIFFDGAKIVHHNVQKIVDKGFSEEDAKNALKLCRNDLGRALASLKRGNGAGDDEDTGRYEGRFSGRGGRGGGRRGGRGGRGGGFGRGDDDADEEHMMGKPSEKISLFDFIGDKLPANIVKAAAATVPSTTTSQPSQPGTFASRSHGRPYDGRGGSNRNGGRPHGEYQGGGSGPPYQASQHQRGSGHPRGSNERDHRGGDRHRPAAAMESHRPMQDRRRNNHAGFADNQQQQQSHNRVQGLNQEMNRMHISNRQAPAAAQPPKQQPQQQDHSNGFPKYDPNRFPAFLSNKEKRSTPHPPQPQLSQPGPQFQQNHRQPRAAHQQANASNGFEAGGGWNWKVGDRCLAKYWEDKKYYNAEVTGVTQATCVVNFMEYGNYEEVVKEDCLPITS